MKITNGSPKLVNKGEIDITPTDIRIGQDWRIIICSTIFVLGIIAGFFMPGPWWLWWVIGFVISLTPFKAKDSRSSYTADQIEKVQVMGIDRVGTKGSGGSLGGAAVGGVLFGGAGAIVGSVAGGNKVEEFTNVVIKFTDGEWVVATSEKGFVGDIQYQNLLKLAGTNNECPI